MKKTLIVVLMIMLMASDVFAVDSDIDLEEYVY